MASPWGATENPEYCKSTFSSKGVEKSKSERPGIRPVEPLAAVHPYPLIELSLCPRSVLNARLRQRLHGGNRRGCTSGHHHRPHHFAYWDRQFRGFRSQREFWSCLYPTQSRFVVVAPGVPSFFLKHCCATQSFKKKLCQSFFLKLCSTA